MTKGNPGSEGKALASYENGYLSIGEEEFFLEDLAYVELEKFVACLNRSHSAAVQEAVRKAVEEQREKDAKFVEDYASTGGNIPYVTMGTKDGYLRVPLAEAIRGRKTT